MNMRPMSDTELLRVLPQFLGITFALLLFAFLREDMRFMYVASGILFLLILRVRFLFILGSVLHTILKTLGSSLVTFILGTLYLTVITLYAFLFRMLNKDIVQKFSYTMPSRTSFVQQERAFTKEDFEKLW